MSNRHRPSRNMTSQVFIKSSDVFHKEPIIGLKIYWKPPPYPIAGEAKEGYLQDQPQVASGEGRILYYKLMLLIYNKVSVLNKTLV